MSVTLDMKKLIFAAAVLPVVLTGCVSSDGTRDNTGTGALEGGAIGALSGAVIGGRNAGAGGFIGAAGGRNLGGVVRHSIHQKPQCRRRPQTTRNYVRHGE